MPLNESSRNRRDLWPLEFDLEGVPKDNRERSRLLEQKKALEEIHTEGNAMPPQNSFAVDYKDAAVTDINNPPQKRYVPSLAENQYPRMMYHHDSGHVLVVNDAAAEKVARARGFQRDPAPNRNYHQARPGRVAPLAEAITREADLTLDEEQLEAGEAEAEAQHAEQAAEAEATQGEATQEEERPRRRR